MNKQDKTTLNHLVTIFQGNRDISEANKILAPTMTAHLDHYEFDISIDAWQAWWRFMREKGQISNVGAGSTQVKENEDGTYTLVGSWRGEFDGKPVLFEPISARYRIQDGKIVEIWTQRANYAFFFPVMRYRLGVVIVFLYLLLWRHFFSYNSQPTLVGGAV